MGAEQEPLPGRARGAAEFVAMMRQLKERSGASLRQLEERAAARGDVLARSTLADALRRPALPRPDVLEAFVHARGAGDQAADWLAARERLATGSTNGDADGGTNGDADTDEDAVRSGDGEGNVRAEPVPETARGARAARVSADAPRRARRAARRFAAAGTALVVGAGAWLGWHTTRDGGGDARAQPPAVSARLHLLAAPGLCVGEGHERGGRYEPLIAAQQPCGGLRVPRTRLGPAGDGHVRIEWHAPGEGADCLAVLGPEAGPAEGMLGPSGGCRADDDRQRFRFEAVGPADSQRYRIRPADGGGCLGVTGGRNERGYAGHELVRQPCAEGAEGAEGQTFVVEPLPTGGGPG